MKKALGYIVIALVAFLLGWGVGPRITPSVPAPQQPLAESQAPAGTAALMLDFGDGTVKTYTDLAFADGETLFDLTKRAAENNGLTFEYQPPGQYGILIDQIGLMRGGTDNKYWLWYENGRMGQVASDAYLLQPGDVLEWKFVNLKME